MTHLQRGIAAEQFVAQELTKNGFTVLERNYRCRLGEIDIIVQKNDLLAFVEVKMRVKHYGDLSELVNQVKQAKIIKAASHFIATHPEYQEMSHRFDVALLHEAINDKQLTYIPNAFTSLY